MNNFVKLSVALSLIVSSASANSSNEIKLPRGSSVSLVAEKIIQNGMLLDIQFYKSTTSPSEVISHLHHQLELMKGELVTRELSKGVLSIGLLQDDSYTTITIEPAALNSTEGFITKAWYTQPQSIPEPRFPISIGSNPISYTGDSIGTSGRNTWVYSTQKSQSYLFNQLAQRVENNGWISDAKESLYLDIDGSRYYSLRKSGKTSEIVISSVNGTTQIAVMEMQ